MTHFHMSSANFHKKTSKVLLKQNPMQNTLLTLLNVTVGATLKNIWGEICKQQVLPPPLGGKNKLTHIILFKTFFLKLVLTYNKKAL